MNRRKMDNKAILAYFYIKMCIKGYKMFALYA